MPKISNRIKASAHHAFMALRGINESNLFDAKKLAAEYFLIQYGRDLSLRENDDIDEELNQLIISKK